MIGYICGKIIGKTDKSMIVCTAGGVGYEVYSPYPLLSQVAAGDQAELFTTMIVREDAQELYGFSSLEERETFQVLLSLSKMGPKTSIAILSHFDAESLMDIAARGDVNSLVRVPGIGKKSAERIVWELRDKLNVKSKVPKAAKPTAGEAPASRLFQDALSGLLNLGYDDDVAQRTVEKVLADNPNAQVGEVLRMALKILAGGK